MPTTQTLSDALTEATHDAEHVMPVHIASGLEMLVFRYLDLDGRWGAPTPVGTFAPDRARDLAAECREMLRISDRLIGRGNNDRRVAIERRLAEFEEYAERA